MNKQKKGNIILDLDNTLISAYSLEDEYNPKLHRDRAKHFKFHNMDGLYIVFERPELQNFLDFLFQNFNVSIWTAATKGYALFIIENVVLAGRVERKIDYIFYSDHCDYSEKKTDATKSLRLLWEKFNIPNYQKSNTAIIDDYDHVYETQPNNCIRVEKFEAINADSEKDSEMKTLIKLLTELLDKLEKNKSITISIKQINKRKNLLGKI